MDERELKLIMNEGATRPETPRDRQERQLLQDDLETSPLKGEPLRRRYRNFRPDADATIRALGGPTIWMRRLRAIEDELERHELQLGEAWRTLAAAVDDASEFARQWQETAERLELPRAQPPDRAAQRELPCGGAAADGSAHPRLREDQRPRVPSRAAGRELDPRPVAGRSHGGARVGVIRDVVVGDADELAALYAANRDFLAPFDPIRPDSFFTATGQRQRLSTPVDGWRFAILDETGAIAGAINVTNVVRGAFRSANVGYFVSQQANGRGLASAALNDVCAFAFGTAGLHRLEAGTLLDNHASQRVLEKNGFEQIGIARKYLQIAGRWQDHLLFQRIAADQ